MIACAIPRRSRIPREYCPTFFLDRGSSPRARIVALTSSSEIRCFRDASLFKFAKPLRSRKKPGFSMIMPTESGKSSSFPICFPPTSTVPLSGCKNPQMHLNITVFPEPLNPIIPWIFPFSKSWVMFFNTFSFWKDFVSPFNLIAYSILPSIYSFVCVKEKL